MSPFFAADGSKVQWKCDVCGKLSSNKSHMKNHVETHVEGVVHNCPLCEKRAKTRESLRVHIHNDHKKTRNPHLT